MMIIEKNILHPIYGKNIPFHPGSYLKNILTYFTV